MDGSFARDAGRVGSWAWVRALAAHPDPLTEMANWVALLIGSHLPFWPLYVWWSVGSDVWPTGLLTMALAPVFLLVPVVSRRSGLAGRMAMVLAGIGNTVWTVWVLGPSSGSVLFLAPCGTLAALLFRRRERWVMLGMTLLPVVVWYLLRAFPMVPLHRYGAAASANLVVLNAISIGVLMTAFGWLLADVYRRMERR